MACYSTTDLADSWTGVYGYEIGKSPRAPPPRRQRAQRGRGRIYARPGLQPARESPTSSSTHAKARGTVLEAVDPQGPDEVVDLSRRDALDVGLGDVRVKGSVDAPAGLEQARGAAPAGDLGDLEPDGAKTRCPSSESDIHCRGRPARSCARRAVRRSAPRPPPPSAPGPGS
jgi:hypothetical protein